MPQFTGPNFELFFHGFVRMEVAGMEKRLCVVQTEKMAVHPLAKGLV